MIQAYQGPQALRPCITDPADPDYVAPVIREDRSSRRRSEPTAFTLREIRTYKCYGVFAEKALTLFSTIGTPYPEENGLSEGSTKTLLISDRRAFPMPGRQCDSIVEIEYTSMPAWRTQTGRRRVIWTEDTGLTSEPIFNSRDRVRSGGSVGPLLNKPIPGGTTRQIPLYTLTATLEGAQTTFAMQQQVGTTNSHEFRKFPPNTLLFLGIRTQLIHGIDTSDQNAGVAALRLVFSARLGEWVYTIAKKDAQGKPIPGTVESFDLYDRTQFNGIWPSGWDGGANA